jgi:hypothetical protein
MDQPIPSHIGDSARHPCWLDSQTIRLPREADHTRRSMKRNTPCRRVWRVEANIYMLDTTPAMPPRPRRSSPQLMWMYPATGRTRLNRPIHRRKAPRQVALSLKSIEGKVIRLPGQGVSAYFVSEDRVIRVMQRWLELVQRLSWEASVNYDTHTNHRSVKHGDYLRSSGHAALWRRQFMFCVACIEFLHLHLHWGIASAYEISFPTGWDIPRFI